MGSGPLVADGPHGVRIASDKVPLIGTYPTSAITIGTSYGTISWATYGGDSTDAVWTSASTITIVTAGYYELQAVVAMSTTAIGSFYCKWLKNGVDLGPEHSQSNDSGYVTQVVAWEPWVRLSPGDTLIVQAKHDASATGTWRESRCAIRLLREVTEMELIKGTGTTVRAGRDETWLTRDTASSSIADTLTTVATITSLPPGRYQYTYYGIYQTTATTTGVGFAVAFSGTATGYAERRLATTGTTAATNAASGATSASTGNLYEAQGQRTLGSLIGAVTVSIDAANTDSRVIVEGDLYVTAIGDLSIQQRAESAGLATTARPGSLLILRRLT
jgi:hypothetical protein